MKEGVVDGVVAIVSDEGTLVALRVVILAGIKAVVDKNHATTGEFLGKGVDKGVLGRVEFAGVGESRGEIGLGSLNQVGLGKGLGLPMKLVVVMGNTHL